MSDSINNISINENPALIPGEQKNLDSFYELGDKYQIENKVVTYSTMTNYHNSTFTVYTSEVDKMNNLVGENDFPYPNANNDNIIRDISKLEIKDENTFMDGRRIRDYINNIGEVNEAQFNICRKCSVLNNAFFCPICQRNLCDVCINICKQNGHNLVDLNILKNEILITRMEITRVITKKYRKEEKPKEKSQKIYELKDEDIDIGKDEIKEDVEKYYRPDDISLIARIIAKGYTNYFHYENIFYCYVYINNRFFNTLDKNCLKIIYEVENNYNIKTIRIFGDSFVNENKNKLTLLINSEPSELIENATFTENYLEVIVIQKPNTEEENYVLNNLSCMFCDCKNLLCITKHIKHNLLDFSKVNDISSMFRNCEKIEYIDFNLFKMYNVKKLKYLFFNCKKLSGIDGLENLNTSEVTSMKKMFYGCSKLRIIKNINGFKTKNVTNFIKMFKKCESLETFPDIENWDMGKAKKLNGMFKNCRQLTLLSDISKWNLVKATNMSQMFCCCVNLKKLPDFTKWELKNIRRLNKMFFGCPSLNPRPNNTTWNISNRQLLIDNNFCDD